MSDARARAVSGGDAPRHRGSHVARAHVSAQERTPLLLFRMWVAALLSLARGYRDARAAMSMRARACLEAAPHAARNWGFVRLLLLSAWPDAPAVVFLAFLTRPTGGNTEERPPKSPRGHPSHQKSSPGIEARPRGLPPATQAPQGGLGPKLSQYHLFLDVALDRPSRVRTRTNGHPSHQPATQATMRAPPAPRHGIGATSQSPSHPKEAWGRNLPNCVSFRTAPSIGSQRGSTLPSRAKLAAPTPAEGNNAAGPSGAGQSGSVEAGPPATHAPARAFDITKKPNSAPKYHRAQ